MRNDRSGFVTFNGQAAAPLDRCGGLGLAWRSSLCCALFLWAALGLVLSTPETSTRPFLVAVGAVAVWRYGWMGLNLLRALIYLKLVFPRLAARSRHDTDLPQVSHVYAVVASYDVDEPVLRSVYRALIENLVAIGRPATIIAAITSDRDCAVLAELAARLDATQAIKICAQFQCGGGKRPALGQALRTIRRDMPPADSLTIFLDGDVVLEPDALVRSFPFLQHDRRLIAITTNNDAVVETRGAAQQWYPLRFAQRHLAMSSLALSRRLLVLTGRFSIYRTEATVNDSFIAAIEQDSMDHWLYGRIPFLSGDDKSMWFDLVRQKSDMLYIADVMAVSHERMPSDNGFLVGSTRLMHRWFGNMLRANAKAMRLGPQCCGWFLWFTLLDQRVSMWTTLLGPASAVLIAVLVSPVYLVCYVCWVLMTRLAASLIQGAVWGRFHPAWPFLMVYGQLWGAVLKTYLLFHPDRQSWTRQRITARSTQGAARLAASALHVLSLATLIAVTALTLTKHGDLF